MNFKLRPALAELIGTFAFVFAGGAALLTDSFTHGLIGWTGIALAYGLILSVLISVFGPISGAHFNPAVSFGLWVAKKQTTPALVLYVVAQLAGSVAAGFALRAIYPPSVWVPVHLSAPALAAGIGFGAALTIEVLLAFLLMLAVLGTLVDPMAPKLGGYGVGLVYAVGILAGGPLTGAAMNPARAFGPGLAAGFWDGQWIYWVGPIAGAAAASWLYTRYLSDTI